LFNSIIKPYGFGGAKVREKGRNQWGRYFGILSVDKFEEMGMKTDFRNNELFIY